MTTPNQPSLEQWQEEFKKTLIYKELMNHHQTGIHPESIKHERLMENMSDFVKPLISQAKAQGAEEERNYVHKIIEVLRDEVSSSVNLRQGEMSGAFLILNKIESLTPQKEENGS